MDSRISRLAFTLLLLALLLPTSRGTALAAVTPFPDVPTDARFAEAVQQLVARGIVRGYPDGRFRPDGPLLRAQTAVTLVRVMELAGPVSRNFGDRGTTDDESWLAVRLLADRDVARGFPDGTFRPDDLLTRQQAISFVSRAMVALGIWQPQIASGSTYADVASVHVSDVATYSHYSGTVPRASGDAPDMSVMGAESVASRGWYAEMLYGAVKTMQKSSGAPTTAAPLVVAAVSARQPATVTVVVDRTKPVGKSQMATGVTHEHYSLDSWGDPTAVARGRAELQASTAYQNQHIMGWGVANPEPAPGVYDWADLDRRVQLMRDTGATKVLTLCCSPDWMKGLPAGTTDWSQLEAAPLPDNVADFAALCRQIALRYPDVQYFQVWNEMKGMWDPARNRWDYERYTTLYNAVYDAIKGVRPDAKIGGPYVVLDSWGNRAAMSNPSGVSGPYGTLDQRPLDVISYWLANKHGADFITVDGGTKNWDGVAITDAFSATQKFVDVADWIRRQPNGGATLPLWWAEWYSSPTSNSYTPDEANAVMATGLMQTLTSGAAVPLVWMPQGDANGNSFPLGLFTDTRTAGGGQATLYYATAKLFRENFGPGTTLYQATASTSGVRVLASATKTLLVSTSASTVTVSVDGKVITLAGYQVLVL